MDEHYQNTLGLSYSTSITDAFKKVGPSIPMCLWDLETFLFTLARTCHAGQLNDWHRMYIEQTCTTIMAEFRSHSDYELPDGTFPSQVVHYVIALTLNHHSHMSVIQAFRYGMMNLIHQKFGNAEKVLEEANRFHMTNNEGKAAFIGKRVRTE